MRWEPKQWWPGEDIIIIGGGPSLEGFDWERLIPYRTIGCNDAYQLGPEVCDVCVFGDQKWFNAHKADLINFPNPVFTNQPFLHTSSPDWLRTMSRRPSGLYRQELGWGGNTGCIAINLALILGAKRVLLLGFDLKRGLKGQSNWHPHNVGVPNEASWKRFKIGFQQIACDLPKVFPGCSIFNLGPDSGLDVFPKMELDDVLETLKQKETQSEPETNVFDPACAV